eukprot:6468296-Amphidinium_carterae.1
MAWGSKQGATLLDHIEEMIRIIIPDASAEELASYLKQRTRKLKPAMTNDEACDLTGFLDEGQMKESKQWLDEVISRTAARTSIDTFTANAAARAPAGAGSSSVELVIKPAKHYQHKEETRASSAQTKEDKKLTELQKKANKCLPVPPKGCRCFIQAYPDACRYQLYYSRPGSGQQSKSAKYSASNLGLSERDVLKGLLKWAWAVHGTLKPDDVCPHELDDL